MKIIWNMIIIGSWWLRFISELNILKEIIGLENDKLIDILNYIKRINSFPNAYITYKIMLTIPVSVAWVGVFQNLN